MHELSFGNRLRQDHDTARRVNALVETIEDLAALVAPDALDDRLRARLDEARRYKIVDAIVNIDFQDPAVTLVPAAQIRRRRQGRDARFLAGYRAPPASLTVFRSAPDDILRGRSRTESWLAHDASAADSEAAYSGRYDKDPFRNKRRTAALNKDDRVPLGTSDQS